MFGSVRFIPHLILKEGWAANGGMECGSPLQRNLWLAYILRLRQHLKNGTHTGDVDLVNCRTETFWPKY